AGARKFSLTGDATNDGVAFSEKNDLLLLRSYDDLSVWSVRDGRRLWVRPDPPDAYFSDDDRFVVLDPLGDKREVLGARTGRKQAEYQAALPAFATLGTAHLLLDNADLWDLDRGERVMQCRAPDLETGDPFYDARVTPAPGGLNVVTFAFDNVILWRIE